MSLTRFIVLSVTIISVVFLASALVRISLYRRHYCFEESRYTMLFGIAHLRHALYFYVISVVALGGLLWYATP